MIKVAILTISDKGSSGEREDTSGALLEELVPKISGEVVYRKVLPDDQGAIADHLRLLADQEGMDLVLTTGGTGVSPRDVTPEATQQAVDRLIPGMAEAMRFEGYRRNPRAVISRALVGIRGRTLIVNLPGSPRGVRESFEVLIPVIPHTLEKIRGDQSDCATS